MLSLCFKAQVKIRSISGNCFWIAASFPSPSYSLREPFDIAMPSFSNWGSILTSIYTAGVLEIQPARLRDSV